MTRRNNASDAFLAKRLAHAEALFDLHSASLKRDVANTIRITLADVRAELERRAESLSRVRNRVHPLLRPTKKSE